jgi:hypothetical protein
MGEFGTVRRRVQKLQVQWKTFEVQHFLFELACNRSIVPPAHFTLCPKLDIHGTDLSYTLQKVAETPWKVTERSGAFLSIQYLINLVRSTWIGRDGTSGNILENWRTISFCFELYPQICTVAQLPSEYKDLKIDFVTLLVHKSKAGPVFFLHQQPTMAKSPKLACIHLTKSLCIALCRYKRDNLAFSQRALVKWLEEIHQVTVT